MQKHFTTPEALAIGDTIALRMVINDTKQLSASYCDLFNHCKDQELREMMNVITPNLVEIQMQLQDKLRKLEMGLPPFSQIAASVMREY